MKVVLALHGFLGLPSDWNQVQEEFHRLQSDYKLVPVDYMNLRGLTPDMNLERWGENFCLWAEKNYPRTEKVIAGYSLGGRLALHALQSKPSAWSKAIFLSTNPGLQSEEDKKIRRESDQKWAQRFQTMDFQTVVREWNSQTVFEKSKREPQRDGKDYHCEVLARALIQWSLGRQQDFSKAAALEKIPNLWLVGENDSKYVEIANRLIAGSPSIATKLIAESSHRLLFDQPHQVAMSFFETLKSQIPAQKYSKQTL